MNRRLQITDYNINPLTKSSSPSTIYSVRASHRSVLPSKAQMDIQSIF